ncbi:hypothetical protein [Vampirovibrio sp.]|uniref:hypothetical protein n=1 Tax=Vampirovibrio sp. TaxID=2717857 RepID=UPI003593C299
MSFALTPHSKAISASNSAFAPIPKKGFFSRQPAEKSSKPRDTFQRHGLTREPLSVQNQRVTTREIFETTRHKSERADGNPYGFHNYSLKYVLFHKPSGNYFKIDRSKYPQVISNEEAAKQDTRHYKDNNRAIFVDGFHQVLHAGGTFLSQKDGPVWVRLNGPVVWPLDFSETKSEAIPPLLEKPIRAQAQQIGDFLKANGTAASKKTSPWQEIIRQLHKETAARFSNQPEKKPRQMGDIIVQLSSLQPDGYVLGKELELFPSEDLPKLWAQKRLNTEED